MSILDKSKCKIAVEDALVQTAFKKIMEEVMKGKEWKIDQPNDQEIQEALGGIALANATKEQKEQAIEKARKAKKEKAWSLGYIGNDTPIKGIRVHIPDQEARTEWGQRYAPSEYIDGKPYKTVVVGRRQNYVPTPKEIADEMAEAAKNKKPITREVAIENIKNEVGIYVDAHPDAQTKKVWIKTDKEGKETKEDLNAASHLKKVIQRAANGAQILVDTMRGNNVAKAKGLKVEQNSLFPEIVRRVKTDDPSRAKVRVTFSAGSTPLAPERPAQPAQPTPAPRQKQMIGE